MDPIIKDMRLKQQLELYLDETGLSAAQLAKKSGVSKQVISLWLSGRSPRKIDQVKKVASIFNTTVDHLCFGDGIHQERQNSKIIETLIGDEWITGVFEIKMRRIKK